MSISPKVLAGIGVLAIVAIVAAAANMQSPGQGAAPEAMPAPIPLANLAATTQPVTSGHAVASGRQLLFFMNPNGYPCQTQLGILNGVADSLSKLAQVVYVKTTEDADMPKFEAYGIRGLPTLVIADKDGRELSRFSPGIQSADAVLAALTK